MAFNLGDTLWSYNIMVTTLYFSYPQSDSDSLHLDLCKVDLKYLTQLIHNAYKLFRDTEFYFISLVDIGPNWEAFYVLYDQYASVPSVFIVGKWTCQPCIA